jgi:hypothetical protein
MTNHLREFTLRQPISNRFLRALSAMFLGRRASTGRQPSAQACTPNEWARSAAQADSGARAHNLILDYHPATLIGWLR